MHMQTILVAVGPKDGTDGCGGNSSNCHLTSNLTHDIIKVAPTNKRSYLYYQYLASVSSSGGDRSEVVILARLHHLHLTWKSLKMIRTTIQVVRTTIQVVRITLQVVRITLQMVRTTTHRLFKWLKLKASRQFCHTKAPSMRDELGA